MEIRIIMFIVRNLGLICRKFWVYCFIVIVASVIEVVKFIVSDIYLAK